MTTSLHDANGQKLPENSFEKTARLGLLIGQFAERTLADSKPFCSGRRRLKYGESNSLGPETAPILLQAIYELLNQTRRD